MAVLGVAVLCVAVVVGRSGNSLDAGTVLIEVEGNPMGTLPSISSSCISGNKACIVAVPGGSLRLTSIAFPDGSGAPGMADAVGYVNGRFVSGTIQLSSQPIHEIDKEGHSPDLVEKSGPPAAVVKQAWRNGPPAIQLRQQQLRARVAKQGRGLKPVSGLQKLADADHEKAAEEQYNAALAAVEGHMKERMDKVEEEATKIAEAVTRVITSPEVSKKIADLAMDAAAAKAGPASEASETGGVQGGVDGVGQFGYSDQPAGVVGMGCGPGCASMSATSPDLETVPTAPPPSSTAFYDAWKAGGAQMGTVPASAPAQQVVVVNNVTQPLWPYVGQPLMPYTLNAAMMGASGFVHGEPLPEDSVSVEPVAGDTGSLVQTEDERAVPVQLHQMNEIGLGLPGAAQGVYPRQQQQAAQGADAGGGLMAQMQAIMSSPGGASAAAQYQQEVQPTPVQQARAARQGVRGPQRQARSLTNPWGAFSAFQTGAPISDD